MTTLGDDLRYISRFEQEVKSLRQAGLHQSLRNSQYTSSNARAHPPFCLYQWHRGKHPTRKEMLSVDELGNCGGWDLGILTAPTDEPASLPDFLKLVDLFGIPSDFVAERFHAVTHSFSTRKLRDESENTLRDPYFLINASFETWHELVDENAWKLVDFSREAEKSIFEHSAQLEIDSSELLAIDYNSIHDLAKDAIHMVEGLDAVLRSLECALHYHSEIEKLQEDDPAIWEAIHRCLHYRKEMFHSTRLRMLSVDQRLKNVINMAFNIGTMHDSRVMRQDSYVMKTLSILAMVFLPISTVSSIFGTQFFATTTSPDPTSSTGAVTTSFVVNKKIWWLWTISIPVTIVMLIGWGVWIKRSQVKAKRLTYWMKDVEKAKSA
ncbi:hypothetical protein BDZ45DRAFT_695785 [Acephala macrosclerotiorum]|nr:hypothetical protein BDZ45DRAFT_695785 [Acephala macrosclerotiorum]